MAVAPKFDVPKRVSNILISLALQRPNAIEENSNESDSWHEISNCGND